MSEIDYSREAFVSVEHVVIRPDGSQHVFPSEEWARWFMTPYPGAVLTTRVIHSFQGLHAGPRQSKEP